VTLGRTCAAASRTERRGRNVSGIVVMRQGENALRVIERVRRAEGVGAGLPAGVRVVRRYDRSELILVRSTT